MFGQPAPMLRPEPLSPQEMFDRHHPTSDPVSPLERATGIAVRIYDRAAKTDDSEARSDALQLLAHLRAATKG